ncbi:MAG: glucose-6-phosphate dehydrogenase [Planctomycetales bacterium]|nr:glucose-6-phosphate dehydrogenase [Planctomycetales bacterium]
MATMVIFGASGDLNRRKLIPALFQLYLKNRLPERTRIVGVSRTPYDDQQWRRLLRESTESLGGGPVDGQRWDEFAKRLFYCSADVSKPEDFVELERYLRNLESGHGQGADDVERVYYLATMPQLYAPAIAHLGAAGMAAENGVSRRLVIEKPFGTDRATAERLNSQTHEVFREHQIYRIDHYLGKETVQNLMVLRFANSIFEPIWNRNYIDHVQITVAEEVTVGDRGGYYDNAGVLRDMFQNHLLQLLMITAMEAPARFRANEVRDEKVKVLRAIRPFAGDDFTNHTVRGQYNGYRAEPGVPSDSRTATFAALKLHVDSWRWNGVPFYLRSGKAMSCRSTQIVIQFREPPHLLFDEFPGANPQPNRLVIQVQPAEGIHLQMQSKVPDANMQLRLMELGFRFSQQYEKLPDAYQRLLMDAISGDPSLFARSDEVELAWGVIDPIIHAWEDGYEMPLGHYDIGYWGPDSCRTWMEQQGRQWFDVCPVLH